MWHWSVIYKDLILIYSFDVIELLYRSVNNLHAIALAHDKPTHSSIYSGVLLLDDSMEKWTWRPKEEILVIDLIFIYIITYAHL